MIYSNSANTSSASSNTDAIFGVTYTLYLEHLGGFLPLLKGKKVSKIRPEFVIYDPSLNGEKAIMFIGSVPRLRGFINVGSHNLGMVRQRL